MTAVEAGRNGVDAVRADSALAHIRTVVASDLAGLRALHIHALDRSVYLRFFSLNRAAAQDYLALLIRLSSTDHLAQVAGIRARWSEWLRYEPQHPAQPRRGVPLRNEDARGRQPLMSANVVEQRRTP